MDEYRSKHCEFKNEKIVKKSASEELSFAYLEKCVYSINNMLIVKEKKLSTVKTIK